LVELPPKVIVTMVLSGMGEAIPTAMTIPMLVGGKIEIDLCVHAVYNRIIVLHMSVSGAVLKIPAGAGG
jgi:hypothetical protein